ncbi:MAG: YIP1 family protein [Deltaproteobacteria bacterium]
MEPQSVAALSLPDCWGHPGIPAIGRCQGCGRDCCDSCGADGALGLSCPLCRSDRIPWEDRGHLGGWRSLTATVQGALFDSDRFFRRLRSPGRLAPALAFSLVVHWIGWSTFALLYAFALPGKPGLALAASDRAFGAALLFTLGGLFGVASDVLLSLCVHGLLRFLGATPGGLRATLRAICYGGAPGVLNATLVLPTFLIPQAWAAICTIRALEHSQGVSWPRAATAVLVPTLAATLGLLALANAAAAHLPV